MEYNSLKVSVIIPVYNVEVYFEKCIRSLFGQTLCEGIEFIFVNDCTPDNSMEVLNRVLKEYPERKLQVKILNHKVNSGSSSTRNSGLDCASGKYIIFCDSDDWVETNMYERLLAEAESDNCDLVGCGFFLDYSNGKQEIEQQLYCGEGVGLIKAMLSGKIHGSTCNKLVKKSLYDSLNIRFPDGVNMLEDLTVGVQLCYSAKKIKFISSALYHYRIVATSISRSVDKVSQQRRINEYQINAASIIHFLQLQLDCSAFYPEIQYFKIFSKLDMLSCNELIPRWKTTYPEAHKYILQCPKLTMKSRLFQWGLAHNWDWLLIVKQIIH